MYGFRCQDVAHCIFFHQSSDRQNEKLLYLSSSVVVIFYYKLRVQRHYTGHENEVVSLCIGYEKDIVASGDKGQSASIHIWDVHSTKSIKQLHNLNIACANLLKFINHDNSLIVVDRRHNSPVYIFDVDSGELITSCQANSFIFDVVSIHNLQGFIPKQDVCREEALSSRQAPQYDKHPLARELGSTPKLSPMTGTGTFNLSQQLSLLTNRMTPQERKPYLSQQLNFNQSRTREMFSNGRLVKNTIKSSSLYKSNLNMRKTRQSQFRPRTSEDEPVALPHRINLLSIDISKNFFLLSENCVFYFEFRGNNYLKKNIYYRTYIVSLTRPRQSRKKNSKTKTRK